MLAERLTHRRQCRVHNGKPHTPTWLLDETDTGSLGIPGTLQPAEVMEVSDAYDKQNPLSRRSIDLL